MSQMIPMIGAILMTCIGLWSIADWANETIHAEKKISSIRAFAAIFTIGAAAVLALTTTSYMPNKMLDAHERRIEFEASAVTQDQVPVRIKGTTIVAMDERTHSQEAIDAACQVISTELVAHMKRSAENEPYSAFYNRCTTGETNNWYNVLSQISAEHHSSLYERARLIDENNNGDAKDPYETARNDRTAAMPSGLQAALSSVNATWNGWVRVKLEPTF